MQITTNKSKVYGYYGGVTNENHYVPPPSIPFTPQPASTDIVDNGEDEIEIVDETGELIP
jgi:hypothetical protein